MAAGVWLLPEGFSGTYVRRILLPRLRLAGTVSAALLCATAAACRGNAAAFTLGEAAEATAEARSAVSLPALPTPEPFPAFAGSDSPVADAFAGSGRIGLGSTLREVLGAPKRGSRQAGEGSGPSPLRSLHGQAARIRAVMRLRSGFARKLAFACDGCSSGQTTTQPPPRHA